MDPAWPRLRFLDGSPASPFTPHAAAGRVPGAGGRQCRPASGAAGTHRHRHDRTAQWAQRRLWARAATRCPTGHRPRQRQRRHQRPPAGTDGARIWLLAVTTFRGRKHEFLSESPVPENGTPGSMIGMWKRSHGLALGAPPTERGGNSDAETYCYRGRVRGRRSPWNARWSWCSSATSEQRMPKPNSTEELFDEPIDFGRVGRRVIKQAEALARERPAATRRSTA